MLHYAPRPRSAVSPKALGTVLALHAAGLAAVLLIRPDLVLPKADPPITVVPIPLPPEPPPPPEPSPREPSPQPRPAAEVTLPRTIVALPPVSPMTGSEFEAPWIELDALPPLGSSVTPVPDAAPLPAPPVIAATAATLLTSGDDLRPPYPPALQRRGEEAKLRLRLAIDARGRVTQVTPLSDADPRFVRAADRHIRKVWRYRPATEAGEPVATTLVVTMRFELTD